MYSRLLIITAGGKSTRWTGPVPKQLITVWGEPLIRRLLRQFSPWATDTIVLSDNVPVCKVCEDLCWFPDDPADADCVAEAVCNTNPVWSDRVIVVHGDVVLSNFQANRIMKYPYDIGFFGSQMDLFALTFTKAEKVNVLLDLAAAANQFRRGVGQGKFWNAYQVHNGIPVGEHRIADNNTFQNVWDWSRDFDMVEEYNEFLDKIEAREIEVD